MTALLGRVFLIEVLLSFSTLSILCPLLCKVSAEKSADSFMGVPLYIKSCFSLAAFEIPVFNILLLYFGMGLFGFILFGIQSFLDLDACFLPQVREVFSHHFFKQVFCPFLSSPSGTLIMQMLVYLMSHKLLKLSSFFPHSFCCSGWVPLSFLLIFFI